MPQWTAAGDDPRLVGLVHHTGPRQAWAYDGKSLLGRLDKARDEALARSRIAWI